MKKYLPQKILSNGAHFEIVAYFNKQNVRVWGDKKPRMLHKKIVHLHHALWSVSVYDSLGQAVIC